jgi:glycosyltransferase involved in cell wall biosynthesis
MSKRILIFNFGLPYHSFIAQHRDLLAQLGVECAYRPLSAFLKKGNEDFGIQFIRGLDARTKLACIDGLASLPDHLDKQTKSGFRARFPNVLLKAFVAFPRQDKLLESVFAALCIGVAASQLACVSSWLSLQRTMRMYDYAGGLRRLYRIFGEDNVGVFLGDGALNEDMRAQDAFWNFTGIDLPQSPVDGLRGLPLDAKYESGRDFCEFIRQCAVALDTLPAVYASARNSLLFPSQKLHLFSPEQRKDFLAVRRTSNDQLAVMLGRERLFPDPDPEPDWKPYPGLTPEAAFAVAERLERNFVEELLCAFDRTPEYCFTREMRQSVVLQALRESAGIAPKFSAVVVEEPRPRLSVLTLTYNHAKFIARTIESVLAQQVDFPMRHIIADDGSDDGTRDIILEYAAKYPHIAPVFRKDRHKTPWNNVIALFDMCRTEYAALCDGDDYFTDPLKLRTQVDFLEKHKDCALCFHVVRVMYEDSPGLQYLYPPEELLPRGIRPFYYLSDLMKCNLIQTNSVMYRWRFKDGLPDWFRSDLCPGDWYWHLLHAETGKIGFINKVMSVYRRHAQGIYYLSSTDRLQHRYHVGMDELKTYDAVNRHFDGKYQTVLSDLANAVMADWLLYSETEDTDTLLSEATERYPDFAKYFLERVRIQEGRLMMSRKASP